MVLKDILLQLTAYPVRTPKPIIECAVAIADRFDTRITAAVCKVDLPDTSNYLARALTDISEAVASEREKCDRAAAALAEEFKAAASRDGQSADAVVLHSVFRIGSGEVIEHARLHDLTILPVGPDQWLQFIAQDLIFGAGRPVLLLPDKRREPMKYDLVVVAWDGSRAAARAVADALPFLQSMQSVQIVSITHDKAIDDASLAGLCRNLAAHGVVAELRNEATQGREGAGDALARFCDQAGADLLVMGAYGHSRVRDFVMGGATQSLLAATPLPILLSH